MSTEIQSGTRTSIPQRALQLTKTTEGQKKLALALAALPVGLNVLAAWWNATGFFGTLFAMLFTLVGSGIPWVVALFAIIGGISAATTGVVRDGPAHSAVVNPIPRIGFALLAGMASWGLATSWMYLGIGAAGVYGLRKLLLNRRRERLLTSRT